jgi:hypothetical protein
MAMRGRILAAGALAALALLVGSSSARAENALKLVLSSAPAVPTSGITGGGDVMTLQLDRDADTVPVWGHRGYWGGGYRGYWGGGYRGYWGGGYRGYWGGYGGWGGYYPRYNSYGGYYPRYYGYYPSYSYYYPSYSYSYYPGFYWGCSLDCNPNSAAVTTVLNDTPNANPPAYSQPYQQPYNQPSVPQQSQQNGTYQYDGGPSNPVPMPKTEPRPTTPTQPSVPLEGRVVSLPSKPGKYVYPAYGEQATRTSGNGTAVTRR